MIYNEHLAAWLIRMVKGLFIGAAFILPGTSGSALAAAFGLYERMILFAANITRDFKDNFVFFLPVGLGGLGGVFLFSLVFGYVFAAAQVQLLWFFIGCVVGTLPSLFRQARSEGGSIGHIGLMVLAYAGSLLMLRYIDLSVGGTLALNFSTWTLTGGLIGLSVIVPGFSTANLLLFLQLYEPMTQGISTLDFAVIVPVAIGGLVAILMFARAMAYLFDRAHTTMYHIIIGFVLASTWMIIPLEYDYLSLGGLICAGVAILGIILGAWMCRLKDRH